MHDNSCNLSQSGLLDLTENLFLEVLNSVLALSKIWFRSDKIWSTNDAGDDEH